MALSPISSASVSPSVVDGRRRVISPRTPFGVVVTFRSVGLVLALAVHAEYVDEADHWAGGTENDGGS